MGSYARRLLLEALKQPERLLKERKFHKRAVFELLLKHMNRLVGDSPDEALRLAEILPGLAELIPGPRKVHIAQAHALAGSAHRAVGDFRASERSYQQAEAQDLPNIEFADVYRRKSYLRMEQGRLDQAFHLINRAIEIYRLEGDLFDRDALGCSLAARGHFHRLAGQKGEALIDYSAAVGLIDHRTDPVGYYGTLHNLSVLLVLEGTPHQVGTVLQQLSAAYRRFIGYSQRHLAKYKLRWLQGLGQARFGATRRAEVNYEIAREGFIELNAPLEVALVSLDLAGVYFDDGRWEELQEMATTTFQICKGLAATREMLAALALWGRAVQEEQLTHALLRQSREKILETGRPAGVEL